MSEWAGRTLTDPPGDIVCERGYILHWCEATENANPLFWDDEVAAEITSGPVAPPSMLSVWMRPLQFKPGREREHRPLELHFQMKEAFGLPEGIVTANELVFHAPVRPGDRVTTTQAVREVGEEKTTRLGTGRAWTIDVTYRNQRGALVGVETYEMFSYRPGGRGGGASAAQQSRARPNPHIETKRIASGPPGSMNRGDRLPSLEVNVSARTVAMGASSSRDWQPQHHDHAWATTRAGTRDIFLNTPSQAGWIERYLTDWTGPRGRLGRLRFRMRRPVCPGDTLVFQGEVKDVTTDESGCRWVDLAVELRVGEEVATECVARVAVPAAEGDNPWRRGPDDWRP